MRGRTRIILTSTTRDPPAIADACVGFSPTLQLAALDSVDNLSRRNRLDKPSVMFPFSRISLILLAALFVVVDSFSFPPNTAQNKLSQALQMASIAPPQDDSIDELSHVLSSEQIKALVKLGSNPETQKIINGFGMWALVVSLITGPIWMAAMGIVESILDSNPNLDPHRGSFDKTGKVWAHAWLRMTNSYPTFSGETSLLRKETGPCLYVANHASWLDIPVLCTVLDPVFKFIAKGELQKVPCVGHQLTGVRIQIVKL
jgi:hypothetical protein